MLPPSEPKPEEHEPETDDFEATKVYPAPELPDADAVTQETILFEKPSAAESTKPSRVCPICGAELQPYQTTCPGLRYRNPASGSIILNKRRTPWTPEKIQRINALGKKSKRKRTLPCGAGGASCATSRVSGGGETKFYRHTGPYLCAARGWFSKHAI